ALGLFDGVHLGHRRVISSAVGVAGLRCAVFTFGRAASALKKGAVSLASPARTERLLSLLGADEWLQADFDAYRELSPVDFVDRVLVGQLGAKRVCCGFNFHFGKNGAGDAPLLRTLCDERGIELVIADELGDDDGRISSDRIRRLIERGEMRDASRLLGHPFVIDTPVSHGQALGRTLGTPTANQVLPEHFVRPRFGVYASTVVIDGVTYYGISNIGLRPTVGADTPLCETWIDGFDGDLYDRRLEVVLTDFLRDEMKFDSLDALRSQIIADRDTARAMREERGIKAILFDFDDTLQDRPAALRQYADVFVDTYRPDLQGEEREAAIATLMTMNNGGYVHYPDYFTDMPKALGVTNAPESAVLFAEYQRLFPSFVTLFDDAASTLSALRDKGYRLGVVTNGPAVQQHRKMDFSGLRPLLDAVLVSMDEGVHKPNPELFRRAAARLGLSPSQCVFVGDHPVNDIEGAIGAGMRAVFIDTRSPSCAFDDVPVIRSLSELLTLF
ncbi:MAG: riboflavin biosynthesis protein RibF, partial [Clostridia bacterium]|nr:riboflavin biosynthesis protein RibF [Clostridia bacterium]